MQHRPVLPAHAGVSQFCDIDSVKSGVVFPARAGVDRAYAASQDLGVLPAHAGVSLEPRPRKLMQHRPVLPAHAGVSQFCDIDSVKSGVVFPARAGVGRKGRENKSGKLLSLRLQG